MLNGEERNVKSVGRRTFLERLGVSTAIATAMMYSRAAVADNSSRRENDPTSGNVDGSTRAGAEQRRNDAFQLRVNAAKEEHEIPIPDHLNNGDELLYPHWWIGNHSKGLPHNSIGEVDDGAYQKLLVAVASGDANDFAAIPLGGGVKSVKLADPQGGLAFTLQGTDSAQLAIPPAPALASAERAGEMVEDYWMALARDVPFSEYGNESITSAAIYDLNRMSDFKGPTAHGLPRQVTPATLFRGSTKGDLVGPYISQFLLLPVRFGAVANQTQIYNTNAATDYLTTFDSWLAVQNGERPFGTNNAPGGTSFIKNGRDLAAYLHLDYLGQAATTASFWLQQHTAPLNPGNPYVSSANQMGGGTFGSQHVLCLAYEAAQLASRAVFYQKWFVHRALRPEAYGGLVHNMLAGVRDYPLHREVLNSDAVSRVFSKYGTYLLPHADPEGCPLHPAYAEQHSATTGAQVTVLKAFYDGRVALGDLMHKNEMLSIASDNGKSLQPYTGSDAGEMTVAGELDKLASNIALGRDIEAVHWRSDAWQGLLLGEAVAISVLRDQHRLFNEPFSGFTFTTFQGETITV
jgi:hypothetical protein